MDPKLIELALIALVDGVKLVREMQAQAGMADEELLALAQANNAEAHATIKKLLAEA